MTTKEVLDKLAASRPSLKDFAVESLSIFGSVAREEAGDASDVDVLVEFKKDSPVGLFAFVRLQRHLSEILGCPVDLVTVEGLREEMRQEILKEAIRAA